MLRRLIYPLIAIFGLLQGFQPLLHAHVGAAAPGHARIHLHALPNSNVTAATGTASMSTASTPDSPSITAAEEYRRHEHLLPSTATPAAGGRFVVAVLGHGAAAPPPASVSAQVAVPRDILPPALAPPRFS